MIKKFLVGYASVGFIEFKSLSVGHNYDLIGGHWECEKHAIMLGCLRNALPLFALHS